MKKIIRFISFCLIIIGCKNSEKEIATNSLVKKDKNVLFIVVDDLNTTLGAYGHPIVKTPNIDALAKSGIQFNKAYANYAVCGPSRGSFLTGLRPENINILDNRTPLQNVLGAKITLPNLFKKNGFETIGLGKIFHGMGDHGDAKAWDAYYNFEVTELGKKGSKRNLTNGFLEWCTWQAAEGTDEDQEDGQIAQKAVELIQTKREKPFFLAVGLKKPHDPFIAPKKYFDIYPLEDCNPPKLSKGWKPPYKFTLPQETKNFNKFNDKDKREFLRSYYACTSFMDAQVGKIMKALKESGQLENTLVVFFGDHGYHLGEHNWWNKVTVFEKGTNAPFIIAGNAVGKKGVKSNSMFEFIDIYPTLAQLMNLKYTPKYLEGESFADVVENPTKSFRSEVRAVTTRGNMIGRMVKNENYRYIEWNNGKSGKELYDQKNDPIEYHNLAGKKEYKTTVAIMSKLLNTEK
ncbi:sulfatase [uncultured Polaribacter sp.]|uniref:sulfatase n=1 Tax=uncultured Polaribacter sp. TaxID=174711 RepID=UPI0026246242|nr:sulfatase [uncultured Polaribacter sp.]